jgi:hypothetical protein
MRCKRWTWWLRRSCKKHFINVPRKASELEACKDLEGHIFTIGSGNKGKGGDMLCTSKEMMATYNGTKVWCTPVCIKKL